MIKFFLENIWLYQKFVILLHCQSVSNSAADNRLKPTQKWQKTKKILSFAEWYDANKDNYSFNEVTSDYISDRLNNCDNVEDVSSDYIQEDFSEWNGGQEIIYYSRAMEYLAENDASLTTSLSLAEDFGFKPSDLNSELLATILLQENNSEEFEIDEVVSLVCDYQIYFSEQEEEEEEDTEDEE